MASTRATGALTAAAVALLLSAAPHPRAALQQVSAPGTTADPLAPLLAALSLLAWCLAVWLAATVLATVAGSCPGRIGRTGATVSRRIAPAAVRRTVELTLGITVAVGALGATSASAAPGPDPSPGAPGAAAPVSGSVSALLPPLDWPSSAAVAASPTAAPTAGSSSVAAPTAGSPSVSAPTEAPSSVTASPSPRTPPLDDAVGQSGHATAPVPARPTDLQRGPARTTATSRTGSVQVRPGDSLWGLAAAHLRAGGRSASDAEVAQAWPQWWQANRQLVGEDPDLLRPGTSLTPPP